MSIYKHSISRPLDYVEAKRPELKSTSIDSTPEELVVEQISTVSFKMVAGHEYVTAEQTIQTIPNEELVQMASNQTITDLTEFGDIDVSTGNISDISDSPAILAGVEPIVDDVNIETKKIKEPKESKEK